MKLAASTVIRETIANAKIIADGDPSLLTDLLLQLLEAIASDLEGK